MNWLPVTHTGSTALRPRERYDKYGGAIFPVAWFDLQQFWARQLPEGTLQLNSIFDFYEETKDAVTVHLKVQFAQALQEKCWNARQS